MILLIDNYDSFTYNLYQLIAPLTDQVQVVRNNKITLLEIDKLKPKGIIISPGPGRPEAAGICVSLIKQFAQTIPILGVCLGHQAIGVAFGGEVVLAPEMMHGKTSSIFHREGVIYQGLVSPFVAGRYHSLMIDKNSLTDLEIEAESEDQLIMGVRHKQFPCYGVQFHPESILTPEGPKLVQNFLNLCK